MTPDLKPVVLEFMQRVWVERDPAAVDLLFDDASVAHGLEGTSNEGAAEFRSFQRLILRQFTDIAHTPRHILQDGAWIAMFSDISGTEIATGKRVSMQIQMMLRFDGTKIAEAHNLIDFVGLFEQLGRLPPRTADLCLLGQVVVPKAAEG